MSSSFEMPSTFSPGSKPQPQALPDISNGTIWSNEIDTFWLYGGDVFNNDNASNSVWRFKATSNEGTWTEIDAKAANLSQRRPSHGAGCNALDKGTAYYLGGYIKPNGPNESSQYLHSITAFDMTTENALAYDIPDYIPIIDPSLVYLDAGTEGVLVVIGGQTEKDGVLNTVDNHGSL